MAKKKDKAAVKQAHYTLQEFFEVLCAVNQYGKVVSREQVVEILLKAREQGK